MQAISGVVSVALRTSLAQCRSVSQVPPHLPEQQGTHAGTCPSRRTDKPCCVCFTSAQEADALVAAVSGRSRVGLPMRWYGVAARTLDSIGGTRVSIQSGVTF